MSNELSISLSLISLASDREAYVTEWYVLGLDLARFFA